MKNRIAKLSEIGKIDFFEEEIPELNNDELLVKIKSVGICGSDLHYFLDGGLGSFKQDLPMNIGHEPSGVVEDANESKVFKKGDRVAIEPGRPCLQCEWCKKGKHNLCKQGTFMGANSQGAFADYIAVHKSQLVKIPDTMSFDCAALMEPMGVAYHAINLVDPKQNKTVAIVGSGSIGLCLYFVLSSIGFSDLIMIDKLDYRVKYAKKIGAWHAINFNDAKSQIKKITDGTGVDYVFDTGGTQDSITLCENIVGTGGKIGLIGIPTSDFVKYNPHKLRTKEVSIYNVRRSNQTLEDCIRLFKDNNKIEKIISHKINFDQIQKGFELMSGYKDKVIKCMVVFD